MDLSSVDILKDNLEKSGVKFLTETVPKEIIKEGDRDLKVLFNDNESENYNTVILSVGR